MSDEKDCLEDVLDLPFGESEITKVAGQAQRSASVIGQTVEKEDYGFQEVKKRNEKLTLLLEEFSNEYIDSKADIQKKREIFYWLAVLILCFIILVNLALVFTAIFAPIKETSVIALIVYTTLTSATSIMTIPIIIAKHLFPVERDVRIVEMLKSVITNDCQIRELNYRDSNEDEPFY